MKSPFRYFKTSPGIIRLAVMMQVRFPLSLRNVEDLRKLMKRYPRPDAIIMDRLKSYRAALRELGGSSLHQAGRWLNNRAENSHLPFRRREHAMLRFRRMRSLQKFAAVHSSVYNHFNLRRPLCSRDTFKLNRAAALAQWRQLGAA